MVKLLIRKELRARDYIRYGFTLEGSSIVINVSLSLSAKNFGSDWNAIYWNTLVDDHKEYKVSYADQSSPLDVLVTLGWTKERILSIMKSEYEEEGLIFPEEVEI